MISETEWRERVEMERKERVKNRAQDRILAGAFMATFGGIAAMIGAVWAYFAFQSLLDFQDPVGALFGLRDLMIAFGFLTGGLALGTFGSGIAFWGLASRSEL